MRLRAFDAEAMLNVDHIAPFQWRHLTKFYSSLLCVSASSTLGSYFTEYLGSLFALSGTLVSFYCFYLIAPWHEKKRVCLLCLGAFFGWAFVNSWLTWFIRVDASLTVSLHLATCIGFGCYLVASKLTHRFKRVYFRALCLSSSLFLMCLHICSYVLRGDSARWKYQMYALLLWYMVYVAAYSQIVLLKARRGEIDYVEHAVRLFTDFPFVLIHCLKLMKAMYRRHRLYR